MISSCMFSSAPITPKNSGHERNHPESAPFEPRDEPGDDGRQGPQSVDDDPGAADEEHEGDDVSAGDETARHGDGRSERPDGRAFRAVVRAGDDHAPPRGGVVAAIELSGRENPGEDRCYDNGCAEQDDRVRKSKSRRIEGHAARNATTGA